MAGTQMKSAAELARDAVTDLLKKPVDGPFAPARFCCDGQSNTTKAVTIRFDDPRFRGLKDVSTKIILSLDRNRQLGSLSPLLDIIKSNTTQSAVSCASIDSSNFSIGFHPHDNAILDVISQVLSPEASGESFGTRSGLTGIGTEILCLGINSKSSRVPMQNHLSRSQDKNYVGQLLVCLPNTYEGGNLRISNRQRTTSLGWDTKSSNSIRWAVVTRGSTFEFSPVITGSQVILSYALRVTDRFESPDAVFPELDPTHFPIYQDIMKMLDTPGFMKDGGKLGFYCRHKYHHTTDTEKNILTSLSGLDYIMYTIFHALGCNVSLKPVLSSCSEYHYEKQKWLEEQAKWTDPIWEPEPEYSAAFREWRKIEQRKINRVGNSLLGLQLSETDVRDWDGTFTAYEELLHQVWPHETLEELTWLNEPTSAEFTDAWELAVRVRDEHLRNLEPDAEILTHMHSSHLIILIDVPKMADRKISRSHTE